MPRLVAGDGALAAGSALAFGLLLEVVEVLLLVGCFISSGHGRLLRITAAQDGRETDLGAEGDGAD